nr:uncharacterized protein LOC113735793 [Coffea arabica]
MECLRNVSRALHLWNKQVFGNLFENVKKGEAMVAAAELRAQSDLSDEAHLELQRAQANLKRLLAVEEQFWSQKARVKIHKIHDSVGDWVMDDEGIRREAVRYFSNLFSTDSVSEFQLLHVIPNLGDDIENMRLEEVPSLVEVKAVIFDMDGDSIARLDGFIGKFFTMAWEVVAHDVYMAIVSFLCGRLSGVLPRIISPQQSGFVKGRSTTDNYLLAQELMSKMGRKCKGGNLALKLDMAKAYDRVSWPFLIAVMRRFGFDERFIDMVWRLISNVWFSTCVVGYKVLRHCPSVSYLGFADDIIIFANSGVDSLRRVIWTLDWYQSDSV